MFVAVANGALAGFMVVTSEVETSSLADVFDLHPFDNFLPVDVYEAQQEAAKDSLQKLKVSRLSGLPSATCLPICHNLKDVCMG